MTLLDHRGQDDAPAATSTQDGLLARIGRASGRHPRRVLLIWALVVACPASLVVRSVHQQHGSRIA